ncbi:CRISPR system precrRNA processing endoribonuclease RAMP protein Cas6 [Thermomicrobium sp. 4228-Ro]|uniref:CRISPR system precrRNA processing endoribonuclease RAMP protein Cas6 n=1 Tax=Thermomicrobium sp. 4228-Ro TaxID=2993937 RepID=UPI002248C43E|nr:CRISPR system precrRNA processing endoribonuclease RAMP protein Cas6 [Thermomicrobium sp. 4228-Ro]MCX2728514.1 CRISPR system precrRNA processing endoribonuclease RAMP protein Cas6 [Thermomicrobium sp. 4228-Ro]
MPVALVFQLHPLRDALLPPFLGRAAHAALLRALATVDPAAARELHDLPGQRPFTVAVLEEGVRSGRRETPARAGVPLHLRVTLLDDELESLVIRALAPGSPVQLGQLPLTVGEPATDHPLAGRARYEELAALLEPGTRHPLRLRLRFFSPTTFHQGTHHLPLPLPKLVFGSLAERWNAFAPVHIAPEVVRGFEHLRVAAYHLETRLVDTGQGKLVGFQGWCEYRSDAVEPPVRAAARALAEFATYAGVGHKVAMGLGQAGLALSCSPERADRTTA